MSHTYQLTDTKLALPGCIFKDTLAVHINPSSLETQDSARREVNPGIVEVISHGKLRNGKHNPVVKIAFTPTKALQFFIAQI